MKKSLETHASQHSTWNSYYRAVKNDGYDVNDPDVAIKIHKAFDSKTTSTGGGGIKLEGKEASFLEPFRSSSQFPDFESGEMVKLDAVLSKGVEVLSLIKKPGEMGRKLFSELFGGIIDQLQLYYREQSALRTAINKDAGLNFQFADAYRNTLTEVNPQLIRYGISFRELSEASKDLVVTTGRFQTLNENTWIRAGQVATAYAGNLGDLIAMIPNFEKVGMGAIDAIESIGQVGKESVSLGLRAQSVTKELNANIGKLNEYGFSNGVKGLGQMVQKSIEFRMSMGEVFKIADKVFEPEGALELTAGLQALGGAIGDFNDPMKLMYMATNNVEGLQDALINAAENLATYNEEQKRFEITGVNLRYAKQMAASLGVSYSELANGAIAAAQRSAAASDLLRSGLIMEDEDKEFITNIAKMKDGRMVIDLGESTQLSNLFGSTEVALENLDEKQVQLIKQYRDTLKSKSEEDIIRDQATSVTNIERDLSFLAALGRKQAGKLGEEVMQTVLSKFKISGKEGSSEEIAKGISGLATELGEVINKFDWKDEIKNLGDKINPYLPGGKETTPTGTTSSTTPTTTPTTPKPQKEEGGGLMDKAKDLYKSMLDKFDSFKDYFSGTFDNTKTSNAYLGSMDKKMDIFSSLSSLQIPTKSIDDQNVFLTSFNKNINDSYNMMYGLLKTYETIFTNISNNNENVTNSFAKYTKSMNEISPKTTVPKDFNTETKQFTYKFYMDESSTDKNQYAKLVSDVSSTSDKLKNIQDDISNKNVNLQDNKSSEMSVKHVHTHEHIVKMPPIMDVFRRIIERNPDIYSDNPKTDSKSYLSAPTKIEI